MTAHDALTDEWLAARSALANGLMALDEHRWLLAADRESLRPHYETQSERFLLPHLAALLDEVARLRGIVAAVEALADECERASVGGEQLFGVPVARVVRLETLRAALESEPS